MNNIKNAYQTTKKYLTWIKSLAVIALGLVSLSSVAENWGSQPQNDMTLPHGQKLGYQPTLSFCIERNTISGNFQAINANQARFNQVWMDQNNAKQGSDAIRALLKMGIKSLYKSFHARSSGAKRYLPDEEGRISTPSFTHYETDYTVHLRSDSLTLGVALAF
ncbi:MAG: hypothetical protein P1U47_06485 [Zhongshania sp.]|uniref:hypothetical protein n=1 Tax=Zhongshania sp. TaxID=1971902 RepID=UPI00260BE729|nr:hypothetical protein [Zhongshania sp.]MDF1691998.1 hypothetical protein [Zhongshania sp.]